MTEANVSKKIPIWINSRRKPFIKHIGKFLGPNKIAQKKWCPAGYGEPDQWKLSRWTDKKTMAAKMADLADPEMLALIAEDIISVGFQDCGAHVNWARQAREKIENWLMDWYVNLFGALDENGVRQETNSWLSKFHCSEI